MKLTKSLMLNEIKNHLGIKKDAEFARFLGIKPQTLSSWYSRDTYDINLLYAKCEVLNAEWLLTGEGEMLKRYKIENENSNIVPEDPTAYEESYWKGRYDELSRKYIDLLEEYNQLLKLKLHDENGL